MTNAAADIVTFWAAAGRKAWFAKDETFDAALRARFEAAHWQAAAGALHDWAAHAEGALALVLLLDQIPRNLFRGTAHAFATDGLSRAIAREAIAKGFDRETAMPLRIFFYMPLEHSEAPDDQDACIRLVEAAGDPDFLRYAILHRDIIARFGRFPHRNVALGRSTTADEIAFLADGGFSG